MHGLNLKYFIISAILIICIFTLNYVKSEEDVNKEDRKVTFEDKEKFDKYAVLIKDFLKLVGKKFFIKSIAGLAAGHHNSDTSVVKSAGRKKHDKKQANMMPVVFHVGAASTWMVVTALLAAKSVVIGLTLLIMKIALSSAKVAAFFTSLKHKQMTHDWTPQVHNQPYYEHGYDMYPHGYLGDHYQFSASAQGKITQGPLSTLNASTLLDIQNPSLPEIVGPSSAVRKAKENVARDRSSDWFESHKDRSQPEWTPDDK